MQHSLDAMKLALRVLTDLTEKRCTEADEVAVLCESAGPKLPGIPLDDLACGVIQGALKHRATAPAASL